MIIQLGIMTCAQRIYINNDDVHYHSPLQNQRGVTYVGCMCGNDFLDLATVQKGRMCAGICVCGFQGAAIKKVAISFYWLRSNKCI